MTTVAALKEQARIRGLAVSGTKAELQQRLDLTRNWDKYETVYVLNRLPIPLPSKSRLACYDLDGTLIEPTTVGATFSSGVDDWRFRPGMLEQVKRYQADGHTILIFTNQARQANRHITLARIEAVAVAIGETCVFTAVGHDQNRKPEIGMWQLAIELLELEPDPTQSFYCGDASGLPGSFSDSDKLFAEAIGLPFVLPLGYNQATSSSSAITTPSELKPTDHQELVILVGCQASGKTTIAKTVFGSYVHASRDFQAARHVRVIERALVEGKSVVVDNTNPSRKARAEYLALARKYNIPARIVVLRTPLDVCKQRNKEREKPIPAVALAMYAKNYEEPSEEEAPVIYV